MTTSRTSSQRRVGRPLKSSLAVAADYGLAESAGEPEARTSGEGVAHSDRGITLAEFEEYLRTTNNRDGRPFEDRTIQAYVLPGKNLDAWMTAQGIEGDFTVADTALLNRYFREYYLERGQGGTHTLQRNLIQLFNFLSRERDHPMPYTEGLNRYAEVKGRPKTLGAEFVNHLLKVTGGGTARDFDNARDYAIIRILRGEGIRRSELLGMVMHTLPADVIKTPLICLVPLKGARAAGEGRLISLAPGSARALAIYLRARRRHRQAASDWLWLGIRGKGRLQETGLRKMLIRRAEEAGYTSVTPHQFRHTFSDAWQMGRVASGATFPQNCDHDAVGDASRTHHGTPTSVIANPQVRLSA